MVTEATAAVRNSKRLKVSARRDGNAVLITIIALAVIGAGGFTAYKMLGSSSTVGMVPEGADLYEVKPMTMDIVVKDDGSLESSKNVEITCQVEGGSTILSILKDGQEVEKDEEIVKLDSSTIEDNINQQKIAVRKAESAKIEAEKNFETALIAVQEYLEGTFVKDIQLIESNITIALANKKSAEDAFEHAKRMARKGFITNLQLEEKEFAVKRAQLELDQRETEKKTLEEFTKKKTLVELESKRDTAEVRKKSEADAYSVEETKLKRLESQLKNCVIRAPQSGMMVYANDMGGMRMMGQQGPKIEEGANVRQYQAIVKIPDLSRMQAKVLVHESKVEFVRNGLPALLSIQGRDYRGEVANVATQPEAGNWFGGNVKEYATTVRIISAADGGPATDLKPGLTAAVSILVDKKENVLTVPLQSVVEINGNHYCWLKNSSGAPEKHLVEIGVSDEKYLEIKSGVQAGDKVILNPKNFIEEAVTGSTDGEEVKEKESKFANDKVKAVEKPVDAGKGASEDKGEPAKGDQAQAGGAGAGNAGAGKAEGGGMKGGKGGGAGGFKFPTPAEYVQQNDKDGDGKLSKDEVPAQAQQWFDMGDENKDGFQDKAEIKKSFDKAKEMMKQRQGGGGPPQG